MQYGYFHGLDFNCEDIKEYYLHTCTVGTKKYIDCGSYKCHSFPGLGIWDTDDGDLFRTIVIYGMDVITNEYLRYRVQ